MARLEQVHPAMRAALVAMECPTFDTHPWVAGPALRQRRVAIISTAGLHRRDDRPFAVTSGNARAIAGDYRVIPHDSAANDLVMSHVSTNFDRTGFQQDWNVVFPLDRLHEMARDGVIGLEELSAADLMRAALQREIGQLRTWYDLAVRTRGRTTVGVSRLTPEEMGTFIGAFLDGHTPPILRSDIPIAALFRFAVEDLKAYYCEAITAQPGQKAAGSQTLADWFWRETAAGRVLFAVQEVCKHTEVPGMPTVGSNFLIPRARSAESPFANA